MTERTPKQVKVTRFKVFANHEQFLRAEVSIDDCPAFVLADYEKGTIRVSWQGGRVDLTMDAYNQHEGDFCDFLSKTLNKHGRDSRETP